MLSFFCRLYSEEELPAEFKLYLPVQQNKPSSGTPGGAIGQANNGQETEDQVISISDAF